MIHMNMIDAYEYTIHRNTTYEYNNTCAYEYIDTYEYTMHIRILYEIHYSQNYRCLLQKSFIKETMFCKRDMNILIHMNMRYISILYMDILICK